MDGGWHNFYNYGPGQWTPVPSLPFHEIQDGSYQPMSQTASVPSIWDLQNHQIMNSAPNQHAPKPSSIALQDPLELQDVAPIELTSGPAPFKESVAQQVHLIKGPSEDEWERHKPKIRELYGKHALKKVMEIMEQDQGFKAR